MQLQLKVGWLPVTDIATHVHLYNNAGPTGLTYLSSVHISGNSDLAWSTMACRSAAIATILLPSFVSSQGCEESHSVLPRYCEWILARSLSTTCESRTLTIWQIHFCIQQSYTSDMWHTHRATAQSLMMEGGPRPGWIIFGNNRERGESRNNAGMKGLKFELRLCELPRGSSLQSICSRVHIQWFTTFESFWVVLWEKSGYEWQDRPFKFGVTTDK